MNFGKITAIPGKIGQTFGLKGMWAKLLGFGIILWVGAMAVRWWLMDNVGKRFVAWRQKLGYTDITEPGAWWEKMRANSVKGTEVAMGTTGLGLKWPENIQTFGAGFLLEPFTDSFWLLDAQKTLAANGY